MRLPRIYADFNNADTDGRIRLNAKGTIEDLVRQKIQLQPGLLLTLYSDDVGDDGEPDELRVNGVVEFADDEQVWVASIDWNAIHHSSTNKKTDLPDGGITRQVG